MTTTTHERLRRTAAEDVGSIPGIEAVVLYGSRARGTARVTSDWDVAILSHAAPDDEEAATRLLGKLERVCPVVMKPESIEAHCNQGTRLESAIARQGRLLAGEWTPPRCRIENLDVNPEDLKRNLDTATDDLRCAFLVLCDGTSTRRLGWHRAAPLGFPAGVEDWQQVWLVYGGPGSPWARQSAVLELLLSVPPDMQEKRRAYLARAAPRKLRKLKVAAATGAVTILVFESTDGYFTESLALIDDVAYTVSAGWTPDEVYLVETRPSAPWRIWKVDASARPQDEPRAAIYYPETEDLAVGVCPRGAHTLWFLARIAVQRERRLAVAGDSAPLDIGLAL